MLGYFFRRRSYVTVFVCASFLLYLLPQRAHPPTMTSATRSAIVALRQQCIVSLGNTTYYLRNRVERTLSLESLDNTSLLPAVVFNADKKHIDVDLLESTIARFLASDDVFAPHFMEGGVLLPQNIDQEQNLAAVPKALEDFLSPNAARILYMKQSEADDLPEGPYFLQGKRLHQAWRLYSDELRSFTAGVVPDDGQVPFRFQPLQAAASNGIYGAVAVPSRLYFPPSPNKPLNGLRVSIKDNFHLDGVVSTLGSRSYTAVYDKQSTTASFIKTLIDQGAQIIGKTKLSAFASAEVPPEKTIDYLAPFNPRGDGYQGPSGSSSGAGSSAAGYEWVDIALGTDTSGSIRMPAASYGLWGMKTTHDSYDLTDVVPSVPIFDVLGILTRSPDRLRQTLALSKLASDTTKNVFPKLTKIIYPTDWFPMADKDQQRMQEDLLAVLEDYANIKHTKLSLKDLWKISGPVEHRETPLAEYLATAVYHPFYYDGYHGFEKFREDHREKFGKKPYISPHMENRWRAGFESTKAERAQAQTEIDVFKKWIKQHVLIPSEDGSSGVIMMMPLGRPSNNPRDIVPPGPPGGSLNIPGYDIINFATLNGFPQLIIPIGQNPYQSRASGLTEFAPIVASLTSVAGSDLFLLHVAQNALEKAGWPTKVMTGRFSLPLGSNSRNTEDTASNARL